MLTEVNGDLSNVNYLETKWDNDFQIEQQRNTAKRCNNIISKFFLIP